MDDVVRYTIGELAERTGLSARTIRFWSDAGVIPPVGRSAGGYRLYGVEAVGRLELVRTLRELGVGLARVREVLEHAGRAVEQGTAPESDSGRAVLDRIVPTDLGPTETAALLEWLDLVAEPRVERYWELLSLIDDRPLGQRAVPAFAWLAEAVRAHR
ncbi:MerR family transcriptional regulator [Nocardia macrotermitis]|uniref:HTH merR-type domain-containing protein n=1 Tax=Nocardia macrotermitis TaxID=2585198 RepID=A0A7K0DAZ6_9NOCA|nr:MerR family transcriptional regulator [Nocardia macrotermitis]MQY22691.1 hypothetical protein [Nocardia macrotermitis]